MCRRSSHPAPALSHKLEAKGKLWAALKARRVNRHLEIPPGLERASVSVCDPRGEARFATDAQQSGWEAWDYARGYSMRVAAP